MPRKRTEYDVNLEIDKHGFVVFGENNPDVHGKWVRWILRPEAGWSTFIEHEDGKHEYLFDTESVQVPTRDVRERALKIMFDRYANPLFKVRFTD